MASANNSTGTIVTFEVLDLTDPSSRTKLGGLGVFEPFILPLRLETWSGSTANSLGVQVAGAAGSTVRIQRSADLKSWQDWKSIILVNLQQTIEDTIEGSGGSRFHRAVSP